MTFIYGDNIKYLNLTFQCEKGSMSVQSIKLNERNVATGYRLLPNNLINRLKDSIYGSTSTRDRYMYTKDSFKIIANTLPNFVIGVGGEGFKNMYELFKTYPYKSTEAHNSYLQIFIESGILGAVTIITIIILCLRKKNSNIKIAFCILIIHSLFDLNFSYMYMLCIFAILASCLKDKVDNIIEYRLLKKIEYITSFVFSIVILYILIKANIAYNMKIPKYGNEELTKEKQFELVQILEKRHKLDVSESKYIESLIQTYRKYLEFEPNDIEVLDKIKEKEELLQKISKYK